MTDALYMSIREHPVGSTSEHPVGSTFPRKRYGRVPAEVLGDRVLSHGSVRLYAVMAMETWEGAVVNIGTRRLAEILHTSQSNIMKWRKALIDQGHIKPFPLKRGQRGWYKLTSEVFAQKQGKVNIIRSTPKGSRLVSVERTSA